MGVFCRNCGKELGETVKFCANCGTSIDPLQNTSAVKQSNENIIEDDEQKVSDKWVWTLACVPVLGLIIGSFIYGFCYGLIGEEMINADIINTIVLIAMNIIFISLDLSELKKKNKKPDSWMWLGFLLVPVYLFVRANKTSKKYGYAITWCILFFISLFIPGSL